MLPPAPNLIGAIRSGFDAITNHILLILFPIVLDLFLWFGPRIRLKGLINSTIEEIFSITASQDPGLLDVLTPMQEIWAFYAERLNMLIFLRSYPVGVSSLIVAKLPLTSPMGVLGYWEIESFSNVFLVFVLVSLVGITGGTLYFLTVGQAAVIGDISWREAFSDWPRASLQMVFLAMLWTAVFLVITIPASFLFSLVFFSGAAYSECALLIFAGVVFWLILPLVFSPHGIVLNQDNFFESVKISANLARKTLPSTTLFVLAAFLVSKGLDILWVNPDEVSWLLLIGILGHAFVTTGILASSFVYYNDAIRWIREMMKLREIKAV